MNRNLGNTLKYGGEWLDDAISLTQGILSSDRKISIQTKRDLFFIGQILTIWIAGIKFVVKYLSESSLEILRKDGTYVSLQKDAKVYVLNNFSSDAPEELVPLSEVKRIQHLLEKEMEASFHNIVKGLYFKEYVGTSTSNPTEGDLKYENGQYWVYGSLMIPAIIKSVSDDEIHLSNINVDEFPQTLICDNTFIKFGLKERISSTEAIYKYISDKKPTINSTLYNFGWIECLIPSKLLDKLK